MDDLISRQAAIEAIQEHKKNVLESCEYDEGIAIGYSAAHRHICDVIERLPTIKANRDEAWELFSLITSTCYGKERYFIEDNGIVYSRVSCRYMTREEAVSEFLRRIGDE